MALGRPRTSRLGRWRRPLPSSREGRADAPQRRSRRADGQEERVPQQVERIVLIPGTRPPELGTENWYRVSGPYLWRAEFIFSKDKNNGSTDDGAPGDEGHWIMDDDKHRQDSEANRIPFTTSRRSPRRNLGSRRSVTGSRHGRVAASSRCSVDARGGARSAPHNRVDSSRYRVFRIGLMMTVALGILPLVPACVQPNAPRAAVSKCTPDVLPVVLRNAVEGPWSEDIYPAPPAIAADVVEGCMNEMRSSAEVESSYMRLDARSLRNDLWFDAVEELAKHGAIWSVASCLSHASCDVRIHALRALAQLRRREVLPFLLQYADTLCTSVGGSESATVHGVAQHEAAAALSAITGMEFSLADGQDSDGLAQATAETRSWMAMNPTKSR